MISIRSRIYNDKATAPGVVLTNEREAGGRLIVALDDDVLEQVAKAGFDGAFVAAIDVNIVGDSALLADVIAARRPPTVSCQC